MLRVVLGFTWRDSITFNDLYGKLSKITAVLKVRRLISDGHIWRTKEELVCLLLIWEPKQGTRERGRPAITYDDQLRNDTGLPTKELKNTMEEREIWKILVDDVRACLKVSQVIPTNSTVSLSLITIRLIFNFTLLLCFLLKIIN